MKKVKIPKILSLGWPAKPSCHICTGDPLPSNARNNPMNSKLWELIYLAKPLFGDQGLIQLGPGSPTRYLVARCYDYVQNFARNCKQNFVQIKQLSYNIYFLDRQMDGRTGTQTHIVPAMPYGEIIF